MAAAAGGGGGPCLVMRDLTMSKNSWANCTITACEDGTFGGGVWQGVNGHEVAEVVSIDSEGGGLLGSV